MKKLLRKKGASLGAFFALALLVFFLPPIPEEYRDFKLNSSLNLTDRNGEALRRNLSPREGVNSWVDLDDMPQILIDSVLSAEDRRFYWHPGADPLALGRASLQNLRAGRVVSGASTITQQLLRTLSPETERGWGVKCREIYWALRVDWTYSKDEILEAYLNRVAFGASVYGAEEAARYYFDKPISAISTAEAAALAVTIRSPSTLDPFTESGRAELALWTAPLLDRLTENGRLTPEAAQRAKSQELELSSNPPPFSAPHFCDLVQSQLGERRGRVETSLDLALQEMVEGAIKTHLALLREHRVGNAAVVIAEVESGRVLALAGSKDYHTQGDGQYNAAISLRQPGSTIKPFTYALLLERTGQAGSILPDLDLYENSELNSFIPDNYDKHFHGPVSIRTALACSYNVPAVRALERVGTENLLETLRRSGFEDLSETPEHYGLGLTLGDGSTSLLQLVAAFRVLARGGEYSPLSFLKHSNPQEARPKSVLSPRASFLISDILSDREARIASFGTPNALELPFPCAVKTGTSKGYRDNWAIGYTPRHVVGVWVGNSDGSPMEDVSGITGAGPLFRDLMLALGGGGDFEKPEGLERVEICTISGNIGNSICPSVLSELSYDDRLLDDCTVCQIDVQGRVVFDMPSLYLDWGRERGLPLKQKTKRDSDDLRFVFPMSNDVFLTDPDLEGKYQRVKFRIAGGKPPYAWEVDGVGASETQATSLWWELQTGFHTVKVVDALQQSKEVTIEVIGKKPSS